MSRTQHPGSNPRKKREDTRREKRRKQREQGAETGARSQRQTLIIAGGISILLFLLIYLTRLDRVVGMMPDDAWYVLLAKALATGQGYTLINSPSPGIVPVYPPAFPFLLSILYRLSPEFPANVWLLKSISIVAVLGTGFATWYYFVRVRELPPLPAMGIAAGTMLSPAFAFLATSTVMSECLFTLVQMAAIIAIERCVRSKKEEVWKYAIIGAALASFAFLVRSMAVGLIVAIVLYLLGNRLTRATLIFVAGVALLAGPWVMYSQAHRPTAEHKLEMSNSFIISSYSDQFWDKLAGSGEGKISAGEIPARVGSMAADIGTQEIGGLLITPLFRSLNLGLAERMDAGRMLLSLLVTLIVIAGFVAAVREKITLVELVVPLSLLIIVLWPFPPFRFVLPLLPFAIFYAGKGVQTLLRLFGGGPTGDRPVSWLLFGATVWFIAVLNVITNLEYIGRRFSPRLTERPRWTRAFDDIEATLQWANQNLPTPDAVASNNPALAHLFTGRKTVAYVDPAGDWERWKQKNVRYIVHALPVGIAAPDESERQYKILYRSGDLGLRVVDLGPVDSRLPWIKEKTK